MTRSTKVNATAVLFSVMHEPERSCYLENGKALPTPEGLIEAREDLGRAQAQWAAAVARAEELLRERQKGGE